MMPVGTAPAETDSKAARANSSSGGTASAIADTSCSRVASSSITMPKIETMSSRPGSSAISDVYASPAAVRPPPAPS